MKWRFYSLRQFAERQAASLARAFPGITLFQRVSTHLAFVRSRYGVLLLNRPGDRTFDFCVRRGYGPFISDILALPRPAFVFLDIGANMGLFSLVAAKNLACVRIVAIEPVPATFHALTANVRRNHAGIVTTVMGAVGSSSGRQIHLTYNPRHSGMSARVAPRTDTVTAAVVSTSDLDALVDDDGLPVIAKIDVEGAERDVLETLAHTRFHGRITDVIVEISAVAADREHQRLLVEMLVGAGYAEVARSGPPEHYDAWYRRPQHA